MIYLYTLPGTAFNAPQISVPLIKGYLRENNLQTKQFDLSAKFLDKCIKKNYIKKLNKSYYNNLSFEEKNIVDNIDKILSEMKNKKINSNKVIRANEDFSNYLKILGNYYSIKWERRGILFSKKLSTIDDVINFANDKNNKLFDDVLVIDYTLNDNDIIYLSLQYPFQLNYAIRFSKYLKSINNKIKIIIGGDYITHINKNIKELMIKCSDIDGCVFFGNHSNLLSLINCYINGNYNINIQNSCYRIKNEIILNISTDIEKIDIDKYIPNFEDLNLNKYLSNLKLIPLNLNYGCYHSKCKFCSRYYYYNGFCNYNLNKLFEYIKEIYYKEHIEAIYFIDECVMPETLIQLATLLIKNKIKIKWMVETRIDNKLRNKEIAKLLYKSGCREISFGIESYNKKILKDMDKRINLSDAKIIMKNFYETGISVSATFMIGYPTENIFNILKTLHFIKSFKYIDTFGLSIFNYMRNSKLVKFTENEESKDLNLIYRVNNDNQELYYTLINKFNNTKKIKKFANTREKILYRSEYMYLKRSSYSLNYK